MAEAAFQVHVKAELKAIHVEQKRTADALESQNGRITDLEHAKVGKDAVKKYLKEQAQEKREGMVGIIGDKRYQIGLTLAMGSIFLGLLALLSRVAERF